ncbi:hypothetical protein HN014_22465 (plasmid) [Aquimarina sp. TRL1]|uniref:hypothetical protein n=1 Tax=Aquimarina sp. (strain TRL1) TaxID=2736252 RepID=UPI00158CBB1B|nr:hypothetical protein [Aquimarina sp. TRL1]QKX07766.1 hypothetical protein HN014_22465 [Aquimarina sp. TRL1]
MDDITKKINDLKNQLEDYAFQDGDVNYITSRLRDIRKELNEKDKVFASKNICQVLGISQQAFIRLEGGKVASDYKSIIKLINIYSMKGYNPLWILKKENFFIDKMDADNNLILNKSSVEIATNNLLTEMKRVNELQQDALEEFKNSIKS